MGPKGMGRGLGAKSRGISRVAKREEQPREPRGKSMESSGERSQKKRTVPRGSSFWDRVWRLIPTRHRPQFRSTLEWNGS